MVPNEFSVLDQKSESVTHVFDLIGESINKPQFIHLCLNIVLLLGRELAFEWSLNLKASQNISRLLSVSLVIILPMQVLDCIHAARAHLWPPRSAQSMLAS